MFRKYFFDLGEDWRDLAASYRKAVAAATAAAVAAAVPAAEAAAAAGSSLQVVYALALRFFVL